MLAGAGFVGLILYVSGVRGDSKCALRGSSVDLPCPAPGMKWFTRHWHDQRLQEITEDGDRVTHTTSSSGPSTLRIKDLKDTDAKTYCCSNDTDKNTCWKSGIDLIVADLQVKVIPSSEEHSVSLMCSTSCPLTQSPAGYIWYRNEELLYRNGSSWYQQLVSSEENAWYSCAVEGHESVRAPEVSVDSVTSTCFTVSYTNGEMCSHQQKSEGQSCSITYPKDVHVHIQRKTPVTDHVKLICDSSCSTDPETSFRWYKNGKYEENVPSLIPMTRTDIFSCAVRDQEEFASDKVCIYELNCNTVNYGSRRICALKGSSVNISCKYSYPGHQQPNTTLWFRKKRSSDEEQIQTTDRVTSHRSSNQHNLTIHDLSLNDSGEYVFSVASDEREQRPNLEFPGVTLLITEMRVKFEPTAVVTEGERVTVTCETDCPLTDDSNYIWYLNSRPIDLTERHNKHLVLDPVSSRHNGNYSCGIKALWLSSNKTTLTVRPRKWTPVAIGCGVALLLIVIAVAVALFLWTRTRRKKSSGRTNGTGTAENVEQINLGHEYDVISTSPTVKEAEHLYCGVPDHVDILYSTVQPHEPQEQEDFTYSLVN